MKHPAKKILTVGLTCVYLILSMISPFAVFHRHPLPVQESPRSLNHELHDAQCNTHVTAHIHLSVHCAACQFASVKQSDFQCVWNPFVDRNINTRSLLCFTLPASQVHLSASAGRAPPSFLS